MTNETKTKKFDSIDLKLQVQEEMRAEFEANRDKFKTYGEYVNWKASQPSDYPEFDAWWEEVQKNTEKERTQKSA